MVSMELVGALPTSLITTEIFILYEVLACSPVNSNSNSGVAIRSSGGARICCSHVAGSLFLENLIRVVITSNV